MIYLLSGANDFAARQALGKLLDAMLRKHGPHAIERVDGEALDAARLPDLLQGMSLFSPERMIVLRDAGRNKPVWEALGNMIEKVPSEITLVLLEPAPDKRTRTYKQLQKYGKVHDFPELSEHELGKWVIGATKDASGSIDAMAATHLVRQVGSNQWQIWTELQKLVAAGGTVTIELIDQLVEPSPQASVFELLDAVLAGRGERAADLLARLKAAEDPYKLFGLLVSQVQSLALVVAAHGKPAETIAKDASVHPFVVRKLQPLARVTSYAQLQRIIAAVALTDTQMKSTGVDPWVLLEQCLGKVAAQKVGSGKSP